MSEEVVEPVETVETPVVEETPAEEPAVEPAGDEPSVDAPQAAAEYVPNLKYKVLDEEREIDHPLFKQMVKDADTEKQVREIFEKAAGLDIYKNKYSTLDTEHKRIAQEYGEVQEAVEQLKVYWANDKEKFFESMGIDPKQVYAWVQEKIKYLDLPQEQKELYDRERATRLRNVEIEQQHARYEAAIQKQQLQARSFELDQGIANPQVSQVAKTYDEIYGQGSFRQEVIKHGALEYQLRGQDVPVGEALSAVFAKAKALTDRLSSGAAPKVEPKVIPTVRAGAGSPAKKRITSIDELKKLAESMQ